MEKPTNNQFNQPNNQFNPAPAEYYKPPQKGEAPVLLSDQKNIKIIGGDGTLNNPQISRHILQGSALMPNQANVNVSSNELRLQIVPTGVVVWLDSNPVARYNHGVKQFNYPCNQITGIQMVSVWIPGFVSKGYDSLIYFYEVLFETLTCTDQNDRCKALLLLIIYFVLLVGPIISVITMAISSIFFLWYIAGNIVRLVNVCRLDSHQYQQNMVFASKAPPFTGQNQFFQISAQNTYLYYQQTGNLAFYQALQSRASAKFMAYRQQFIDSNYAYMISFKMIMFHVVFMGLSALCLVGSVKIFPSIYGIKH